jgi:hypothetical protein
MVVGYLLIGMITGLIAGAGMLIMGHGLVAAFLVYVGIGVAATAFGVLSRIFPPQPARFSDARPVQKG